MKIDKPQRRGLKLALGIAGGAIGLGLLSQLGGEILWFQEVNYLSVLGKRLVVQGLLAGGSLGLTLAYFLVHLRIAHRLQYPKVLPTRRNGLLTEPRWDVPEDLAQRPRVQPTAIGGWALFGLAGAASLLLVLVVLYYAQLVVQIGNHAPNQLLAVPERFRPDVVLVWVKQLGGAGGAIGLVAVGTIGVLIWPSRLIPGLLLTLSVSTAATLFQYWDKSIQFFNSVDFNLPEPVFGNDIAFYMFKLPVLQLLEFWLTGVSLSAFVAIGLVYLLSANSLSEGRFPGFSWAQKRHLYTLGGLLMLVVAIGYGLGCYELLYSPRGVTFGASYTDLMARLPANRLLAVGALGIAIYFFGRSLFWPQEPSSRRRVVYVLVGYVAVAGLVGEGWPAMVQSFVVQPNELVREEPYIARTIALTRRAFGLDAIDVQTFNPVGRLTEADLRANDLTIRNIRLWDERPLLDTNRQLQQIRPYYRFLGADIDRYTLPAAATHSAVGPVNGRDRPTAMNPASPLEQQQILIAARELDYRGVPQQAQTWINEHLIYTHGYGFTVSPVNKVAAGGLPEYFVKDFGVGPEGSLVTSSPVIRERIPIDNPRIYYGEITNSYVMTNTKVKALDYPSGSENVYATYDGTGGILMGQGWRRWLFAAYLKDWRLAITPECLPETRLLFRRNINQRIRAIAPFLKYDSDPYLVSVNVPLAGQPSRIDSNHLYWIVDAYTVSDHYPYSDVGDEKINYIRNSVKAVINAYSGQVDFYVANPTDPMIRSWMKIFPELFKPLDQMPEALRLHLRYPIDFFQVQSHRLMTYHMTDPQVFYNREDEWQIPTEIYGDQPRSVKPYYLITSLPGVPFEEFILLLPYSPRQRTNLIAWLAARSDGQNYGKQLLYVFPKDRLVYGPEQIEARINQDPVISQQISLWNRQGSRAIQGNLLVIPIEQSLLYVEPLYLEATQNSLPTLVRVIVAYENRIVMAQTLEQALKAIFKGENPETPAIVRPVEGNPGSN